MRSHPAVVLAAAAALAVPVAATADVAPHSTWYAIQPKSQKPHDDVFIDIRRDTHKAYVTVTNYCLGTGSYTMPNGKVQHYPDSASLGPLPARSAKLSFRGKATLYTAKASRKIPVRFTALKGRRRYSGTVSFQGTKCRTIHFVSVYGGMTK